MPPTIHLHHHQIFVADAAVFVCASFPSSRPWPAAHRVLSAASPLTAAHLAGLAAR